MAAGSRRKDAKTARLPNVERMTIAAIITASTTMLRARLTTMCMHQGGASRERRRRESADKASGRPMTTVDARKTRP